jgi:hypothetical protein
MQLSLNEDFAGPLALSFDGGAKRIENLMVHGRILS